MPEVQNVGAVDYTQYQPSQYQQENYANDFNTQPEVYDENYAQMQTANKSRMGATILAAAITAGIGIGAYYLGKSRAGGGNIDGVKKELENVKKELTELKDSEAIKNYDKLKTATEEVEKYVNEKSWYNFRGVKNKIKKAFGFLKEDAAKVTEEAKDKVNKETEKAVDEVKDAATELKEHATDTNK